MATPSTQCHAHLSPLLRLPVEIRLDIYSLLLCTQPSRTLEIRTASPTRLPAPRRRTTYRYLKDRMRSRSAVSTYRLIPKRRWPPSSISTIIHTAILQTNKQIHKEATHALYATHTFDFGLDIEAIAPFLGDLTPQGRRCVRSISFAKRALPYVKDFDRCEWAGACAYIAAHLSDSLVSLHLDVYGGCPADNGASRSFGVQTPMSIDDDDGLESSRRRQRQHSSYISKEDFAAMARCGAEEMEWARQLARVNGLKELGVRAIMEHCPPPESSAMAFFVGFSRSIERGFGEWLKGIMVREEEKVEEGGRGWEFDALRWDDWNEEMVN